MLTSVVGISYVGQLHIKVVYGLSYPLLRKKAQDAWFLYTPPSTNHIKHQASQYIGSGSCFLHTD